MLLTHEAVLKTLRVAQQIRRKRITHPAFRIMVYRGFNYYAVDLASAQFDTIKDIISGCEAVENDTWIAQEDFYQYIRKSDLLVYAERNGTIVGFNLVSFLLVNEYCFYTIDEAMVLRDFQGNNLARNVVTIALWWFSKKIQLDSAVTKMVLVSISANPKVVNNYYKNRYLTRVLDNSFFPSADLVRVHHGYLGKHKYKLIDKEFPFCIRNLFPGSQQFDWNDRRYQFLDKVRMRMPSDFDHTVRGDAWAFMTVANIRLAFVFIRVVTLIFFGRRALLNKKIGLLKRNKTIDDRLRLSRIRLVNGLSEE